MDGCVRTLVRWPAVYTGVYIGTIVYINDGLEFSNVRPSVPWKDAGARGLVSPSPYQHVSSGECKRFPACSSVIP